MAPLHMLLYFKSWDSAWNFVTVLVLLLVEYITVVLQMAILETYLKENI